MTEAALDELERLLREERDAIRTLDGTKVLAFAKRKEEIVRSLVGPGASLEAAQSQRLKALVPALRHNGVLLAHARDIMRDALAAVGMATKPAHSISATQRRLLSVRG